jgi:hypothetical protein
MNALRRGDDSLAPCRCGIQLGNAARPPTGGSPLSPRRSSTVTSRTHHAPATRAKDISKVISIASRTAAPASSVAAPRAATAAHATRDTDAAPERIRGDVTAPAGDAIRADAAPSLTDELLAVCAVVELPIDPLDEALDEPLDGAASGSVDAPVSGPDNSTIKLQRQKRRPRLPQTLPKPRKTRSAAKAARSVLTGYYISRDTIYGPERSGEFYVRGERIYLSRRALAGRTGIPGATSREVGRVLGDLAGMPRATGTVANRVAAREVAPIPTGYFTINGRIYGGMGRATDAVAGVQRVGNDVSAQLAKGEFRIAGNLIYGPPGRRVPWLTAIASTVVEPTKTTKWRQAAAPTTRPFPTKPKRAKKSTRRKAA